MFKRNLTSGRAPKDVEIEEVLAGNMRRDRTQAGATLHTIVEEELPAPPHPVTDTLRIEDGTARVSTGVEQLEFSELPTQVLRVAGEEMEDSGIVPAKKRRLGYASFRMSQKRTSQELLMHVEEPFIPQKEQEQPITDTPKTIRRVDRPIRSSGKQAEKYSQDLPQTKFPQEIAITMQENLDKHQHEELHVSQMLEQAGLADAPLLVARDQEPRIPQRKRTSDGSETPLGSLDRTKVDLGESDVTTDAQRFLRKEWGTQGTMLKIVKLLNKGVQPLTVRVLVARGPVPSGQQRLVAARCFTALMKLKKHSFINIEKDFETLEVVDISCGPKIRLLH